VKPRPLFQDFNTEVWGALASWALLSLFFFQGLLARAYSWPLPITLALTGIVSAAVGGVALMPIAILFGRFALPATIGLLVACRLLQAAYSQGWLDSIMSILRRL